MSTVWEFILEDNILNRKLVKTNAIKDFYLLSVSFLLTSNLISPTEDENNRLTLLSSHFYYNVLLLLWIREPAKFCIIRCAGSESAGRVHKCIKVKPQEYFGYQDDVTQSLSSVSFFDVNVTSITLASFLFKGSI